jgi:hypothetical protein
MGAAGRSRLIATRLVQALPSIFGIILVTFILTRALPGDPAVYFAGPTADAASIEQVRTALGLDRSLPEQFVRYLATSPPAISAPRSRPACRWSRTSGGACRPRSS